MEESYESNIYSQNNKENQIEQSIYPNSQIKVNNKTSKRHSKHLPKRINTTNLNEEQSDNKFKGGNGKYNSPLPSSRNFDNNFENNQGYEQNLLLDESSNENRIKKKRVSEHMSSSSVGNILMEKSYAVKNYQNCDESGRDYKSMNKVNDHYSKREARLSIYNNSQSPIITELSKNKDLSNGSDISVNSKSKVKIDKQGSILSLNSGTNISSTVEEDTLLELSINSLELLGSYLKNSSKEKLNRRISSASSYEERFYNNKNISDRMNYNNKRDSSIFLPYLKLNEFIENQEISDTITSISKGWPVEKSGFILRKMIYSNGIYNSMNHHQDNQEKDLSSKSSGYRFSNQNKKKGKHKKDQSRDNYNEMIHGNVNHLIDTTENKDNKDWDWGLFYVELRGHYLFFYRLYSTEPYWKKDNHSKSKSKPGTLENIRNVFVERIISFKRNKKNSSHSTTINNNNNKNDNSNNNSENNNNVIYNPKLHEYIPVDDYIDHQQHQQALASKEEAVFRSKSNSSQHKLSLQQQLLASQNIYPNNSKNSPSKISRSFTFANITSSGSLRKHNNSSEVNDVMGSPTLEMNPNSPFSSLPPQPIYSPSYTSRQYVNSNSSGLTSPYLSPLNTNFSSYKSSSNHQLTPNSMSSPNDTDYTPLVVPSVPNTNTSSSKYNSYSQVNSSVIRKGASPFINNIPNTIPEDEEESLNDDISNMEKILPPQINNESEASDISYSETVQSNIRSGHDIQNSLENSTTVTTTTTETETIKTKVIATNINSHIIRGIDDSYQPSSESEAEINQNVNQTTTTQTTTTITTTTTKKTSSILSSVSTISNISPIEKSQFNSRKTSDSFVNMNQINRISIIEKNQNSPSLRSPSRTSDSFTNINQLPRRTSFNSSSKPSLKQPRSMEFSKVIKRRSKLNELTSFPIQEYMEDNIESPYLESSKESQVSTDISMSEEHNQSFNRSLSSIQSSLSNIVPPSMDVTTPRRQSKIFMSTIQSPSSNKYYENQHSSHHCNSNDNNASTSSPPLPPSTPMVRVTNNNSSKRSSIHKQKHHNTSSKIVGKPILSLNDVNGPLDVLRAKRVLVHYIPLNNSIVEPLSVTEIINSKNGTKTTKEIPSLLLTYANQDKIFSSACQVLLQMTNIGLGTITSPSTPFSVGTPKSEINEEDISPLPNQRRLSTRSTPLFSIGQNNSFNSFNTIDQEGQLVENEIIDWCKHIQQSSNVIENISMNSSWYNQEKGSPQMFYNEEHKQRMDYIQDLPEYNNNSSSRNSDMLPSSHYNNIPSVSTPMSYQNESPVITKQEMASAVTNRGIFSVNTPIYYEGNNTSYIMESVIEDHDLTNKSVTPQAHSYPYDPKDIEIIESSPFISGSSTPSLNDDKLELTTNKEGINGTEKGQDSMIATPVSQESQRNKHSKLNASFEESSDKEIIHTDREIRSFDVVKTKDIEMKSDNASGIHQKTPSVVCEDNSPMLSGDIVNKNTKSPNNGSNSRMINFNGNKPLNTNSNAKNPKSVKSKNNSNAYMDLSSQKQNSGISAPPEKPQKSIMRIKESEIKSPPTVPPKDKINSSSNDMYIDVKINPKQKSSHTNSPLSASKNIPLKGLKPAPDSPSYSTKENDNIPSNITNNSSMAKETKMAKRKNSTPVNYTSPNQKQSLFKSKSLKVRDHKPYPRKDSLKKIVTIFDKSILDESHSSPRINQTPNSQSSPYTDLYNIGFKEDYKMESINTKDRNVSSKKKNPLFKKKDKVQDKEKPSKPSNEDINTEIPIKEIPEESPLLEEIEEQTKEKETEEVNKVYSKELEKKPFKEKETFKEKEGIKKKSKKEVKREKKEKKIEEKLEKQEKKHQDKLDKIKISSPKPLSAEEYAYVSSPTNSAKSNMREKLKKSSTAWYQLALSKLPTTKSSSQGKKKYLFSDFKKGDTNTELLIKRTPTCSSLTSVRKRVVNSNRTSVCTNGTTNTVSTQASIPYGTQFDTLPEVPAILKKCITLIEEIGLETEGLYRISGNSSNVQNLLKLFQHEPNRIILLPPGNEPPKSSSRKNYKSSSGIPPPTSSLYKDSRYLYDNDIHVVTGCIKSWLRNGMSPKNEPLWPYDKYNDLIEASKVKDYTTRMIAFQDLVHALPPKNFTALNFLFEHLYKVSTFADQNKMSISNLAIIFGPTLLKSPPDDKENELMIITRMPFQCKAVEILIEHYEWLFGPIEYEEESIDEEDLGIEFINSSFQNIQNQLHGEIKDNEVVILKHTSNNDIDIVVSTTDKLGVIPIRNGNELNTTKNKEDKKTTSDMDNSLCEEPSQEADTPSDYDQMKTEKDDPDQEDPNEPIEQVLTPRKEKPYFELNDYNTRGSQNSLSTFESHKQDFSELDMPPFDPNNELNKKDLSERQAISEQEAQNYNSSLEESIPRKKKASEELYDYNRDDEIHDKSSKGNNKKEKEKSKTKVKNNLKQLLIRPNKSKKMDSENISSPSPNHLKSLISSPISIHQSSNTSNLSHESDELVLDNTNKNSSNYSKDEKNGNPMTSSPSAIHDSSEHDISHLRSSLIRMMSELIIGSGNENSEKSIDSNNNNSESTKEKKKAKDLSQKISNSSMRIFQEQFLMDGFENDIESSLNDFLSKKYDEDESNITNNEKEENQITKNSLIKLSSQMTAKLNVELEKHLEQICKDKKKAKLFINEYVNV